MTLAPWHADNWQRLLARRAQGRLPHALLLAGPAGLGKRAFAEALAGVLLCERGGDVTCGECRSCRLYATRVQRDPEESRPDGSLAHADGHSGHPDARFVSFALNEKSSPKKMYTVITVEQMRDLSGWLALTAHYGRAKVALIDPADALNDNAANALLKTLEEPDNGCFLVLISSQPARLPATIRSRCQRIDFALPPPAQAQAWLVAQQVDAKSAAAALQAAGGNPGTALELVRSGGLALRDEVDRDLRDLRAGKAAASDVANRWARSLPEQRLWFAAMLLQAQVRERSDVPALTSPGDLPKLSAGFDRINRARDALRGPLRPELVVLDALSVLTN